MRAIHAYLRLLPSARLSARARRFGRREDGLAGVEFALVLPFLVTLGLGANEFTRYVLISKRATVAATSIAQMVSSTTDELSASELDNYSHSVLAMPNLSRDAAASPIHYWGAARVNIASIKFKPVNPSCTSASCEHAAHVLWSWGWTRRQCGELQIVSDQQTPSATTIPRSLIGPGSVVSVELSYDYVPIVGAGLFPRQRINRTAFFAPRYVPVAELASNIPRQYHFSRCPGV